MNFIIRSFENGYLIVVSTCDVIFTDTSFVPPLIYAFMGSSRDIAIGPVAVVSLLLGSLLQDEIDPIAHPLEYRRLAFTATFFAGVTQATLGVLRYIPPFILHYYCNLAVTSVSSN